MSILLQPARVHACSCATQGTPSEELYRSDAVFLGRVIETKLNEGQLDYTATFEVIKSWRGITSPRTQVRTSVPHGGGCGYGFVCGMKYLVYVTAGMTSICHRTIDAVRADKDIFELGDPIYVNKEAGLGVNRPGFSGDPIP